ncbi:MAG: glycosyltransferase family 2 protein [Caldilineaceae bacterium]|nr:glycosyltransferase family 2 protein [Caldilineaceae bacterium]
MLSWIFFFQLMLWLVGALLALPIGYLLLLTVAAWLSPKTTPRPVTGPTHRFVFLVPAHNEEKLLPALLANLRQLDYPTALVTLAIVADNCTDQTAALARAGGARVYERFDQHQIGKGYALQWLLAQLQAEGLPFDAAVILDADSVISPNFLTVMDAKLAQGERVIQAHYAVLEPNRSWVMGLRAAALALVHYLRPLGRTTLGASVGLKGNGMVFHHTILAEHQWSASVTEDIEYHMSLVLAGERVAFAPDATVWAEMPGSLQGAQTQNVRWEQGRFQLARQYVPRLVRAAFQRSSQAKVPTVFVLLDSAMEHLIPPFTIVTGMTALYLLFTWLQPAFALRAFGLILFGGQLLYIMAGLILARTPLRTYLAFFYAPIFLLWKLRLLFRVMTRTEQQGWVRTARDGA